MARKWYTTWTAALVGVLCWQLLGDQCLAEEGSIVYAADQADGPSGETLISTQTVEAPAGAEDQPAGEKNTAKADADAAAESEANFKVRLANFFNQPPVEPSEPETTEPPL